MPSDVTAVRGTTSKRRFDRARAELIAIHGVWGAALLLFPERFIRRTGSQHPAAALGVAARVLGARHVSEAGLLARSPHRPPPRWPIAIDALHAASMLGLAAASPRLRGNALASATIAFCLAGLAAWER